MTYTLCRLSPGKAINRASSLSIHFSLDGRKTHSGMQLAVRVTLRNAIRVHPPLEYKYMRNLIKCNLMLAKRFSNTMRYIDDLLTLIHHSIQLLMTYPEELTLKKTLESPTQLSYLDIQITIVNGKYTSFIF